MGGLPGHDADRGYGAFLVAEKFRPPCLPHNVHVSVRRWMRRKLLRRFGMVLTLLPAPPHRTPFEWGDDIRTKYYPMY